MLLPVRGRADVFAALLDADHAQTTAPTTGPVALVERLRVVAPELGRTAVPDEEFTAALRTRLLAVAHIQATTQTATTQTAITQTATTQTATARRAPARRRARGLSLASGVAAVALVAGGVTVGASQSLPGDPLYGLKRDAEGVQLRFDSGSLAKGQHHLAFASNRLHEARALADRRILASYGGPPAPDGDRLLAAAGTLSPATQRRIAVTLTEMDEQTRTGWALLLAAYRSHPDDDSPLRIMLRFSDRQAGELSGLLPLLPAASRRLASAALSFAVQVGGQAGAIRSQACGGCPLDGPGSGVGSPGGSGSATPGPSDGRSAGATEPAVPGMPDMPPPGLPGMPPPGLPGMPPPGSPVPGAPRSGGPDDTPPGHDDRPKESHPPHRTDDPGKHHPKPAGSTLPVPTTSPVPTASVPTTPLPTTPVPTTPEATLPDELDPIPSTPELGAAR